MAFFLRQAAQRYGKPLLEWSAGDLVRWQAYDWPGNVRDLKNAADRCCLGLPDGLPVVAGTVDPAQSLVARVDQAEKGFIEVALRMAQGSVAAAADVLQIPKKTLYDKLVRHSIVPENFR
jgi:two-component system C4-dicarboxylate transport response regulator DctD